LHLHKITCGRLNSENQLRNQAQQLFDVANEMRKRQTNESLAFEERYWATILIDLMSSIGS
jgi:hypothetical protein